MPLCNDKGVTTTPYGVDGMDMGVKNFEKQKA